MGIHYTYKSIRGEKAMKKEAKRKARLEQRRAKKGPKPIESENEKMHDIEKTITLEDLTNPNKKLILMKSALKKESSLDRKELALRSNLKKRKEYKNKYCKKRKKA